MKTFKILMFSALVVSAISSCTDKYKSLAEANKPPVLELSKAVIENRLNDTITENGKLILIASDHNNNLKHFQVVNPSPEKVEVYYSGNKIQNNVIPIIGDSTKLFVILKEPGTVELSFFLSDRFDAVSEKKLLVKSRDNYAPAAAFVETETEKHEYKIDAGQSVDPDGRIVEYIFEIEGVEISSHTPVIHHIFYSLGDKTIKLRVKDDAGKESAVFTKTITII